ncbi:MAG: tetratricopeptide repeat protein [Planctomycetota bacterium]
MTCFPRIVFLFILVSFGFIPAWSAPEEEGQDPALPLYYNANALYNRKLYKLSLEEYDTFIERYPRHEKRPQADLGQGLCLYALGDYVKAVPVLLRLSKDDRLQNQQEIHNLLGQSLLRLDRTREAESAFSWAVANGNDKAQKEHAWVGWIETQYRQSRWAEVVPNAGQFLRENPNSDQARRIRFQGAVARFELKSFKPAKDELEALAQSDENSPMMQHIVFLLAECHRELGEVSDALKRYDQAARKMEGAFTAEALYRLGFVRFNNSDFKRASNDFSSVLEDHGASPCAPSAMLYLGRSFYELENFREAEKVLDSIGDTSPVYAHARLWLARTHLAQGEVEAAEQALAEALRLASSDPLFPDLLYEYGYTQMEQGKYEAAALSFEKLPQGYPEHALACDAQWLQAFCLHKLGDFRTSDQLCSAFLSKRGQSKPAGEVSFLHAENQFLLENRSEAVALFTGFLEKYSDHFYVPSARFRIAQAHYYQNRWSDALAALGLLLTDPPQSAFFDQLFFIEGDCQFNLEAWDKAVEGFTRFVAAHPEADRVDLAAFKAALALEHAGNINKAISVLETFLNRFRASQYRSRAAVQLGRLQYDAGKYAEARQAFQQAIDLDQDPYAIYHQAYVSLAEKRSEEARRQFQLFSDLYPDHELVPDAMLQQGILLLNEEKYKESRRILEALLACHAMHETAEHAGFYLGVALARLEDRQAAADRFQDFLERYPASALKDRALYEWAWCAKGMDQAGRSMQIYTELLNACPESPLFCDACFELAELEYGMKQYDRSIPRLESLAGRSLDPEKRERVLYRLGWNCFSNDRMERAAHWFDLLLEEFPASKQRAFALYQSGEAHLVRKEYEEAYQRFLQVVDLRDAHDLLEQALLRLGECAALTQRWQESENVYRRFTQEFGSSEFMNQALYGMGWALESQENYAEAIKAYENVVMRGRFDETSARSQFQIGECYFSLKQYNEAVKALIKVEVMYAYPKWSARALLETGRALEIPGKGTEARAQYEELIKKYPDSESATVARKKLANLNNG